MAASVGIIGAGIGGLTLALACRHLGIGDVRVYPGTPPANADDFVLELSANATRVLHALGMQEALEILAFVPQFSFVRVHSGFQLIQRPLGAFAVARYGAPTYLITRTELLSVLTQACRSGGVVFAEESIDEITTETGELQFREDNHLTHDAIVGCDGSASAVRELISRENPQSEVEICVITARTTLAPVDRSVTTWSGPGHFCVQYPVSDSRTDLLLVLHSQRKLFTTAEATMAEMSQAWHERLRRCVDKMTHARLHEPANSRPLENWYAGKVALLGDACHPLPVYSAQGACAAIEDAWVLATMMERWDDNPAGGFSDYQRYRLPRVKKIHRESIVTAAQLLSAGRNDIWRRNIKWGLSSRFLPEITMQRQDWLYGYDCIKGFA